MNEKYISNVLKESIKAYKENEVPVGAIIVYNDKIIARAHNTKRKGNNACLHAEMIAIDRATKKIGNWRLNGAIMYVALEPCPMCAGAIQQSRIKKVYSLTDSKYINNLEIIKKIFNNPEYNHQVQYECLNIEKFGNLISDFFANKR